MDATPPHHDPASSPKPARPAHTSQIIARIGDPHAGPYISFHDLLHEFRQRAFGGLLLVVLLPTFLPAPGIGAFTGPFITLIGAQMLLAFGRPWLPRWIAQRQMKRATVRRFGESFHPFLLRLEKVCKPRLPQFLEHTWAFVFTGLQLVVLGLLLSLPIPFTNYPLGFLLLLYCIALIERDGLLLLISWVLGLGTIAASVLLSTEVIELIRRVLG